MIPQTDDANCCGKCEAMVRLSPREREVLILFVQKGKLTLVAEALGSSLSTVRTQKYNIMRKLGETTSVGLVRSAIQKGLTKP